MTETLRQEVAWLHNLNKTAKSGSIVFTGSTFMHNFPINELEHNFQMEESVYNRGVQGLCIADFPYVLENCVFELAPSKLFVCIGEEDVALENFDESVFLDEYEQIILTIRRHLPACKLYIIGLMPTVCGYEKTNRAIRSCANELDCEFLDFGNVLLDTSNQIKKEYSKDKKTFLPGAYVAILRDLKMFFRNRMMGFGEVWNMVENWG